MVEDERLSGALPTDYREIVTGERVHPART
jgi:hypothetical protein